MKLPVISALTALCLLTATASAQDNGPRYAEYWQSYRNVEIKYPAGYPSTTAVDPGWEYEIEAVSMPVQHRECTNPYRECTNPYPATGVWDKRNNSMENSTYKNWGGTKDGYSCDRFLTKPCAPSKVCVKPASAPEAPVTFSAGTASDLYLANAALIDDLKSMYCLPSHIIYRLRSRNDAAYQRLQAGGSPAMPAANLERVTLSGLRDELLKLRATCIDGKVR